MGVMDINETNNSIKQIYEKCKIKFEEKCVREALARNPRLIEREIQKKQRKTVRLILVKQEYYIGRPKKSYIDIVFKDSNKEPTYYLVEIKYKVDPLEASKIVKYAVKFSMKEKTDRIIKIIAVDVSKIPSIKDKEKIERELNCLLVPYKPVYIMDILEGKKKPRIPIIRIPKKPVIPENILNKVENVVKENALKVIQSEYDWYKKKLLWKWIDEGIEDRNLLFFYSIFDGIYHGNTGVRLSKHIRSFEDLIKFKDVIYNFIFEPGIKLLTGVRKYKDKHRIAIIKLINYFSETPPVDYVRNTFRRELANTDDTLLARRRVYDHFVEILKDCGFSGDHETRYPVDVLFETQIFSGYLDASEKQGKSGNIDFALKKISPEFKWNQKAKDFLHRTVADRLGVDTRTVNLALWHYGVSLKSKKNKK